MKLSSIRVAFSFCALVICALGCGQTGPLYLPQTEPPRVTPKSTNNPQTDAAKPPSSATAEPSAAQTSSLQNSSAH